MYLYLWPDGDYQIVDDLEEPSHPWKSDDLVALHIPEDVEDPDEWAHQVHLEVNLGESCERSRV